MVAIMIPSQGETKKFASIRMTYRSQMEEALHHPPQRLGLLLEACNPRIETKMHQELKSTMINRNDSLTPSKVQPNHSNILKPLHQPPDRSITSERCYTDTRSSNEETSMC